MFTRLFLLHADNGGDIWYSCQK